MSYIIYVGDTTTKKLKGGKQIMNIIQERETLKTITSMVEEIQLTLKKEQNLVVGEDEIYKMLEISQNDLETPSELRLISESLTGEFEKDGFSELASELADNIA